MGQGYATLAYGTGKKTCVDGHNTAVLVYISEALWMLPNFARGKTIRVEYWTQIDMDKVRATHTDYAAPSAADTSMVVFYAASEQRYNSPDYSSSVNTWIGDYIYKNDGNAPGRGPASMKSTSLMGLNTNSNYNKFSAADTVGHNWQHVSATWHAPHDEDYIIISIIHDSRFPADAVRISNLSVTIDDEYPSRW
jgi:hypothetical protein